MNLGFLRRQRAIGLDVGGRGVRALALERRRSEVVVVGRGAASTEATDDSVEMSQAVHAALADAGVLGEPVIVAVGGPDVVIRQVSLPPLARTKVLPVLELQYRELGLPAPRDSVTDAQILRNSKREAGGNEILSVSVPKSRYDARVRFLQQASVKVRMIDVEALALLNGAIHLTGLDAGELLVLLTMGDRTSVLCLFSEQGPVVARYLNVGAESFLEQVQTALPGVVRHTRDSQPISATDLPKAEAACGELVERVAEDVRLSLTFYRTEYDRESLPRYAIGGTISLPHVSRWVADRLGLGAPLELMDPFRVIDVKAPQTKADLTASGPQFLHAFGLALRGL